jgi:hypothetical protein
MEARCPLRLRVTRIGADGSVTEELAREEEAEPLLTAKERTTGAARSDGLGLVATARTD